MFSLLRKLVKVGGSSRPAARPLRPPAATREVLTRGATRPAAPQPKPAEQAFDPYNTGAFDRSSSWERIGKRDY